MTRFDGALRWARRSTRVARIGLGTVASMCALAAATNPRDPSDGVFLAPVSRAVESVCPDDAPEMCDTIGVDVASLRRALEPAGLAVTSETIAAGLGRPVRDVPTDSVYRCEAGQAIEDCRSYVSGVHVRVEPVQAGHDTISFDAMIGWTGRAEPFPAGFALVRFTYERRAGTWVFAGERLLAVT